MNKAEYSVNDIIQQLNTCARTQSFPMLDNGYRYLGDVQLSAYGDRRRWAIIIEVTGINYRLWQYQRFETALYCFGNCLREEPGITNNRFLCPVPEQEDIFDEEMGWFLRPEATSLVVRDTTVIIPRKPEVYSEKGIVLEQEGRISIVEMMRALLPEHRELLLANERERRRYIPVDLPLILHLAEWCHPDLVEEEPSEIETFYLIAQALLQNDAAAYKPTKEPNTHWRYWPYGGAS